MNSPVSFKLAKLLKEKGFNEPCLKGYSNLEKSKEELRDIDRSEFATFEGAGKYFSNSDLPKYDIEFTAPTIAEVVMWLYEKYGVWITVNVIMDDKWFFELYNFKNRENPNIILDDSDKCWLDSPTEAYEAAIKYILNDLL